MTAARAQLAELSMRDLSWPLLPVLPAEAPSRPAAVLVLFGVLDARPADAVDAPVARDLDVLLQRRAATLGSHPGQISFPGGRVEAADADPAATALREATEETGLDAAGVEILGMLPELIVPRSNHIVTPVLAWWRERSHVAAVDHRETQDVFRAPVADLLDPERRASVERSWRDRTVRTPAFDLGDGLIVWGFTAMVLDRVFDAAGWTEPWDPDRLVEPLY